MSKKYKEKEKNNILNNKRERERTKVNIFL